MAFTMIPKQSLKRFKQNPLISDSHGILAPRGFPKPPVRSPHRAFHAARTTTLWEQQRVSTGSQNTPPSPPPTPPPRLLENDAAESIEYALAVLKRLMLRADRDRDDSFRCRGPLHSRGDVVEQRMHDSQDIKAMVRELQSHLPLPRGEEGAGIVRDIHEHEMRKKRRSSVGQSSDLADELLINDITLRVSDRYHVDYATIEPAYAAARARQGYSDPDMLHVKDIWI
ncbi:hypothetical protein B0H63DRAFT_538538 [Podospora didyma]|uniref:Uncharacterized protein n=1 Tax=Podospora didyma TaxID=330526 RepID=A0AAE0NYT3_9PEZI|nr:hypothetical protein B0H63DRAFT_538538 [Podospora didyma]